MKVLRITFLFIFILIFFVPNIYGQDIKISEFKSFVERNVVRIRTPDTGSGTGFIIGKTDANLYILTAAHVVTNYVGEMVNVFFHQTVKMKHQALVIVIFDDLDLAVLKIEIDSIGDPVGANKLIHSRLKLHDCDINEDAIAIGYPGASLDLNFIQTKILSSRYDSNRLFFKVGAASIVEGISGSPVFNSNREYIGTLIEVHNSGTAARVVQLNSIIQALDSKSIIHNLLKKNSIIHVWKLKSIKKDNIVYDLSGKNLSLKFTDNGDVRGVVNGHYCLKGLGQINFNTVGIPHSIALPEDVNGVYSSASIGLNPACNIFIPLGFSFGGSGESGPVALKLDCNTNFGNLIYEFIP